MTEFITAVGLDVADGEDVVHAGEPMSLQAAIQQNATAAIERFASTVAHLTQATGAHAASAVSYANAGTGLAAANMQTGLTEVNALVAALTTIVDSLVSTVGELVPLTADEVTVSDEAGLYTGTTVEAILAEINPGRFTQAVGGGQEGINTVSNASGAVTLDLNQGNVQRIASTTGTYTLTVTGASPSRATSFMVVIDTTTAGHVPTWWSNITWVGGAPPSSAYVGGGRLVFSFLSLNGATWTAWWLNPPVPVEFAPTYSYPGTLPSAAAGVSKWTNDTGETLTLAAVRVNLGTAPTGAANTWDLRINGVAATTTGNRPQVAPGQTTGLATTFSAATIAPGDVLTIDLVAGNNAANAVITVAYRRTA